MRGIPFREYTIGNLFMHFLLIPNIPENKYIKLFKRHIYNDLYKEPSHVHSKWDGRHSFMIYKRRLKDWFRKTWWEIDINYPQTQEISGPFNSLEELREFKRIREIMEG